MKNFNLDNLEKKIPYKIPDEFFGEMQRNVLKEVSIKKEKNTKVFKINFSMITSLAAALAMVLGFTFLWKTNQTDISKPVIQEPVMVNTASNTITTNNISIKTGAETEKKVSAPKQEVVHSKTQEIATQIVNSKNTDENYEQLLYALSDEELAELSTNTDHDIYLELYN